MFPQKGHMIPSWLLIALLICLTFSHFLQIAAADQKAGKVPKFKRLKRLSQPNGFCCFRSLLGTLWTCHRGKTVAVKKKSQCECWCCGADEVWRCVEDALQVNTWKHVLIEAKVMSVLWKLERLMSDKVLHVGTFFCGWCCVVDARWKHNPPTPPPPPLA